jgi:hypothetical protein
VHLNVFTMYFNVFKKKSMYFEVCRWYINVYNEFYVIRLECVHWYKMPLSKSYKWMAWTLNNRHWQHLLLLSSQCSKVSKINSYFLIYTYSYIPHYMLSLVAHSIANDSCYVNFASNSIKQLYFKNHRRKKLSFKNKM